MVKKGKDFLKRAGAMILLTSSFATTACNVVPQTNIENPESYSSAAQIERIADGLGCDLSVMKFLSQDNDKIYRMKHNSGEPIYVSFEKDYPEEYMVLAQQSLDYMFSAVGAINDLYSSYSIVESKDAKKLESDGKTVIEYKLNGDDIMQPTWGGYAKQEYLLKQNDQDPVYVLSNPEIIMNFDDIKSKDNKVVYGAYLHELMHVFGFGDVYTDESQFETSKYMGNTHMKANHGVLLPNDYACLLANYAKPMDNQAEVDEYIQKANAKLDDYTDWYYEYLVDYAKEKNSSVSSNLQAATGEVLVSEFLRTLTDLDGETTAEKHTVVVDGDQYKIFVTDMQGNVLDKASGKSRLIDGVYVFENAEFESNVSHLDVWQYDGYVTDLVLMQTEDRDYLYNPSNNDTFWGVTKEKTQDIQTEK